MQFVCCPYNPYFALINLSHFENIQQKNIFFHNFLIRFFLLPKINNWPIQRNQVKVLLGRFRNNCLCTIQVTDKTK